MYVVCNVTCTVPICVRSVYILLDDQSKTIKKRKREDIKKRKHKICLDDIYICVCFAHTDICLVPK
jgi:hypothetical protein